MKLASSAKALYQDAEKACAPMWRRVDPAISAVIARRGGGVSPPLRPYVLALCACIAYNSCMQYTIRNIPKALDTILRQRAREQGKSLNEVAIETLAHGAGVSGERARQRDLRDIAGTWQRDPAFDAALVAQDTVDKELWE